MLVNPSEPLTLRLPEISAVPTILVLPVNSVFPSTIKPPLIVVLVFIKTSTTSKITLSDDDTYNPPLISTKVFTDNPPFSDMDAVNEPDEIDGWGGISSANADNGISNKSLPLPLNEPLNSYAVTEPLTSTLPSTCTKLTNSTISD